MLEGLDGTRWDDLGGDGSAARRVPALLRTLATGGAEASAALDDLFDALWHQGTVDGVSAVAVPFVGELCVDDSIDPDHRAQLLFLLFLIGRGRGFWQDNQTAAARARSRGRDVDRELAAEARTVEACRRAAERVAGQVLAGLGEAPPRLRLPIASLALMAGQAGHKAIPLLRALMPSLSPFGAAAVDLVTVLLRDRSAPIERFSAVEDHSDLLEDYGAFMREDGCQVIAIDDHLVQLLAEEMCR